jgi:malonyl-CoA decarboxylase
VSQACDRWRADPSAANLAALSRAVEAPRGELFRRMSMLPGGGAALLMLREALFPHIGLNPEFALIDAELNRILRP